MGNRCNDRRNKTLQDVVVLQNNEPEDDARGVQEALFQRLVIIVSFQLLVSVRISCSMQSLAFHPGERKKEKKSLQWQETTGFY